MSGVLNLYVVFEEPSRFGLPGFARVWFSSYSCVIYFIELDYSTPCTFIIIYFKFFNLFVQKFTSKTEVDHV